MDKFIKYALIAWVLALTIMTISGYIGYQVGGNSATDDNVNDAAGGGTEPVSPFTIEPFGETGEYVGFFIVGAVGGIVVGYLLPGLFNNKTIARREN